MNNFIIKPSKFLIEQVKKLDNKAKKTIYDKKELIKINPFRYKKVHSKNYNHVFSVRLSSKREAKRLIYVVIKNIIFLCFILDRSKGYKDLEQYFKKIEDERKKGHVMGIN